jgi:hypothetical protein
MIQQRLIIPLHDDAHIRICRRSAWRTGQSR